MGGPRRGRRWSAWLADGAPAPQTHGIVAMQPLTERSQNAPGRLAISRLQTHERKEAMWCAALPRPLHAPAPPPHHPTTHRLTAPPHHHPASFQLRDALKVGNIHLHSDFFSVQLDDREAVKIIRDELTRFAIVVEPAKTLFGKTRRTYTGKIGGQNDDLAMTLQLAVSGIRCFYQNPKVRSGVEP